MDVCADSGLQAKRLSSPIAANFWGAFTNRNGQEWTSITGMDLKIHPKIHVLSVLDKKFWLSNVEYQISSVSRHFQCKKNVF